jgi:hypothetical protein
MPLANPFLSSIASRVLDRRASVYSDRPRLVVAHEILSGGLFAAFIPYGDLLVPLYVSNFGTDLFLLVGVALAAQDMKCSRKQ